MFVSDCGLGFLVDLIIFALHNCEGRPLMMMMMMMMMIVMSRDILLSSKKWTHFSVV
jgi:hypothetical protein